MRGAARCIRCGLEHVEFGVFAESSHGDSWRVFQHRSLWFREGVLEEDAGSRGTNIYVVIKTTREKTVTREKFSSEQSTGQAQRGPPGLKGG